MNRRAWVSGLVLLAAGALACTKLISGRCEVDSDCGGQMCDATKHCVARTDGGTGGAGGQGGAAGSKGTGGTPFTCPNSTCKGATPICDVDAGSCRACDTVGATACGDLDAGTPVCTPGDAGSFAGTCVGCLGNGDCHGTKPICDATTHACTACGSDGDCKDVGPGVCMTDGHCATDAETIYVRGDQTACNDSPAAADGGSNAGTKAHPFCSMQPVPTVVAPGRALVVVDGASGTVAGGTWSYANQAQPGQLAVVGQNNATIGSISTPAFSLGSGTVSIRQVTFSSVSSNGISASGGTLSLDHVTVENCKGGILLNGATFDIEDTTVAMNGTAIDNNVTSWSGIFVKALVDGGTSMLHLVTVSGNSTIGVVCSGPISSSGVLGTGNQGGTDFTPSCQITNCTNAGPDCGAQP